MFLSQSLRESQASSSEEVQRRRLSHKKPRLESNNDRALDTADTGEPEIDDGYIETQPTGSKRARSPIASNTEASQQSHPALDQNIGRQADRVAQHIVKSLPSTEGLEKIKNLLEDQIYEQIYREGFNAGLRKRLRDHEEQAKAAEDAEERRKKAEEEAAEAEQQNREQDYLQKVNDWEKRMEKFERDLQTASSERDGKNSALSADLEKAKTTCQTLETANASLQSRFNELGGKLKELQVRNVSYNDTVNKLQRKNTELGEKVEELEGTNNALRKKVDDAYQRHEQMFIIVDAEYQKHEQMLARVDAEYQRHEQMFTCVDAAYQRHEEALVNADAAYQRHEQALTNADAAIRTLEEIVADETDETDEIGEIDEVDDAEETELQHIPTETTNMNANMVDDNLAPSTTNEPQYEGWTNVQHGSFVGQPLASAVPPQIGMAQSGSRMQDHEQGSWAATGGDDVGALRGGAGASMQPGQVAEDEEIPDDDGISSLEEFQDDDEIPEEEWISVLGDIPEDEEIPEEEEEWISPVGKGKAPVRGDSSTENRLPSPPPPPPAFPAAPSMQTGNNAVGGNSGVAGPSTRGPASVGPSSSGRTFALAPGSFQTFRPSHGDLDDLLDPEETPEPKSVWGRWA